MIESYAAIETGTLPELSAQQVSKSFHRNLGENLVIVILEASSMSPLLVQNIVLHHVEQAKK